MPDPQSPDDGELVGRCLKGDAGGWQLLVHRYQRLVHAIARRAGLDDHVAADVFQTVFSRLLQALPRIEQPQRLRAWIVTTAKREALLQLRLGRRSVSLTGTGTGDADDGASALDQLADESPLAEQQLDDLQQLHLLRLAMDRLDARCHDLLTLLFADDGERLPYEQVAARLDMPAGSIGPTRARCLAKLRTLLERGAGE